MPTSRQDSRIRCPFYRYDECRKKERVHRITCEGIMDDCSLILSYRLKRDFFIQMETFCCRHFDRCEVYRMLMEKYQDAV